MFIDVFALLNWWFLNDFITRTTGRAFCQNMSFFFLIAISSFIKIQNDYSSQRKLKIHGFLCYFVKTTVWKENLAHWVVAAI